MFKTSSFGNPLYDAIIDEKKPPIQSEEDEEEINHHGNEAVCQNEADIENQARDEDIGGNVANVGDGSGGLDNPLYSEVFAAFSEKDEE